MEFPWSVPWIEMHTTERFLKTLSEERWGLVETEGELAVMVEDEANQSVPKDSSHSVLQAAEHYGPPMAMGDAPGLIDQMQGLAELLREFASTCSGYIVFRDPKPSDGDAYYDAQKALYRMVDHAQRFVDEYR